MSMKAKELREIILAVPLDPRGRVVYCDGSYCDKSESPLPNPRQPHGPIPQQVGASHQGAGIRSDRSLILVCQGRRISVFDIKFIVICFSYSRGRGRTPRPSGCWARDTCPLKPVLGP
jgi:hypothetical protein